MKKGDKELLLKDLCARLPYGVKVHAKFIDTDTNTKVEKDGALSMIDNDAVVAFTCDDTNCYIYVAIHEVRPYLFPLSSMTPKQKAELSMLVVGVEDIFKSFLIEVEFYHKHHIDYRGLIEKSLALDATNLNIY